jgi:hypothetical protein
MDFNTARMIALNVPIGAPSFYAAEAVCMVRGLDPWAASPHGMPYWQTVIVEQMCCRAITEELWPNKP